MNNERRNLIQAIFIVVGILISLTGLNLLNINLDASITEKVIVILSIIGGAVTGLISSWVLFKLLKIKKI